MIGPGTGISTRLGLLDARGPAFARALAACGLRPRMPGKQPLGSIAELEAWLDQGPLLMDGARWFGEGHWFVAIGYDKNGVYIRDSKRPVTTHPGRRTQDVAAAPKRGRSQPHL